MQTQKKKPIITRDEYIKSCLDLVGSLEDSDGVKSTLFKVLHDMCHQYTQKSPNSTLLEDDVYNLWQLWHIVNTIAELRARDCMPN